MSTRRLSAPIGFILACAVGSLTLTGCGNSTQTGSAAPTQQTPTTSSPEQLAVGFIHSSEAKDLQAASQDFAPDKQPTSWNQIMNMDDSLPSDQVPNLWSCQGISYTTIEQQLGISASVIFTFANACARDTSEYDELTSNAHFGVDLEYANDRWYVGDVQDNVDLNNFTS